MLVRSKIFKLVSVLLLVSFFVCCTAGLGLNANVFQLKKAEAGAKSPKYIFYFIADGLGVEHKQVAEYFLQQKTGDPEAKLTMSKFPVTGIITTHSADSLVTDSAAAGTALATGFKTNNRMISKLPDGTDVKTLLELAEQKGKATGVVTTTRLTHATPAVFLAHNENRGNENEIAEDYLDSGVDYLAGGGYRHFVPKDWKWGRSKRKDNRNIAQEFYEKGYRIFIGEHDTEKFRNYKPKVAERVFAAFTYSHLPYEIDRKNDNKTPSLSELTEKGIEVLMRHDRSYGRGFFMMVEGGRIDHAAHANDLPGVIHDVLEFDRALAKAYEFYKKYPNDTLIVVVSDHETGGLSLGLGTNYFLKLENILDAKVSVSDTLHKKYTGDREAMFEYLAENFALNNLNAEEKAEIERAMGIVDNKIETKEYGGYVNPVAIAAAHVLSKRANVFWTTYAHSAAPVPICAIGVGAHNFAGFKDNTEVAHAIAKVMGVKLGVVNKTAYKKAS